MIGTLSKKQIGQGYCVEMVSNITAVAVERYIKEQADKFGDED